MNINAMDLVLPECTGTSYFVLFSASLKYSQINKGSRKYSVSFSTQLCET